MGALGILLWGCGGAPGWVTACNKPATIEQDKVVACGAADILEGDVENATSLAGAKARDKLATFILQAQKRDGDTKKLYVELQGTELRTKWVAPNKVFVLVDMDVHMSQKAQIKQSLTSAKPGLTPESQDQHDKVKKE
ncbi:hypothetical protein [Helicobacter vulpis]|uniref:hypothetical protein n=1 Tax=Helicobacter vulpis TaxID=2316076 RepID=UPI000EB112C3|nr:hypothetical protein [Helicobacter vulpis]